MPGQVLDRLVGKDTRHDAVHPALQVPRDVRDALAPAQAGVGRRDVDRVAVQLRHAGLEGHARAQRWFPENHRQRLSVQRFLVGAGILLHVDGLLQNRGDLLDGEIPYRNEVPAFEWLHGSHPQGVMRVPPRPDRAETHRRNEVMMTWWPVALAKSTAA